MISRLVSRSFSLMLCIRRLSCRWTHNESDLSADPFSTGILFSVWSRRRLDCFPFQVQCLWSVDYVQRTKPSLLPVRPPVCMFFHTRLARLAADSCFGMTIYPKWCKGFV
ncbi:hypothetical protein EDD21DRAFT_372899 [Dissophora ornata]|nr:hypothetical protein EDD21DRAFT_372899 [Dissophora ornata]